MHLIYSLNADFVTVWVEANVITAENYYTHLFRCFEAFNDAKFGNFFKMVWKLVVKWASSHGQTCLTIFSLCQGAFIKFTHSII